MKSVVPYLNFEGNAREAFDFYEKVLGGKRMGLLTYSEMGMDGPDPNLVAHTALDFGNGHMLMASDMNGKRMGNAVQIVLEPESADEAERIYRELSQGGDARMPLERTQWAERYGECSDRFGVSWVVNYTGNVSFGSTEATDRETTPT